MYVHAGDLFYCTKFAVGRLKTLLLDFHDENYTFSSIFHHNLLYGAHKIKQTTFDIYVNIDFCGSCGQMYLFEQVVKFIKYSTSHS